MIAQPFGPFFALGRGIFTQARWRSFCTDPRSFTGSLMQAERRDSSASDVDGPPAVLWPFPAPEARKAPHVGTSLC